MWKCSIRSSKWLVIVAALAAGCATVREPSPFAPSRVTAFSTIKPGDGLPPEWGPWTLNRFKTSSRYRLVEDAGATVLQGSARDSASGLIHRSEEHTSELQSLTNLVCRLLLEKKKKIRSSRVLFG